MAELLERLPITVPELDDLIDRVTIEYQIPKNDQTVGAIAETIMHMPRTQAFGTLETFGHAAVKQLAQLAAWTKLEELRQQRDKADLQKKAELTLVPESTDSASGEKPI